MRVKALALAEDDDDIYETVALDNLEGQLGDSYSWPSLHSRVGWVVSPQCSIWKNLDIKELISDN